MRLVKPAHVVHNDEKERPGTIFSLSVHPDGSRLATGGLDTKIKIWSTAAILNENAEKSERVPKLLSTLTTHSGVVMCVRWSHGGRYLASGSDDNIVIVWSLDSGAGGKVWGTTETNVENWKAARRLVGHDSDVAGVAWNSDDSFLASVGLDSTVMVWSGSTFELVRKLDGHQGFVKGVVWDPVGQYLATQSDDMSVKIWRTADWGLDATITAPFKNAPAATFTRLSWSPEGTHVVTPNSMNGPVFVAAVIDRTNWDSKTSMVGHENVIEVAAFNPQIFLRNPAAEPSGGNLCTLLALSGRNSISLWMTSQSQPLVVLDEVFDRDVLDMSWSADGMSLWSCSSEGHVAVFTFDPSEFNVIAPPGTRERHHSTYNFKRRIPLQPVSANSQSQGSQGPTVGTMAKPNMLVSRKGGARRIVPQPVLSNGVSRTVPLMGQVVAQLQAQAFAPPPMQLQTAFAQAVNNSPFLNNSPQPPQQYFSPHAGPSNANWGGVVDSRKRKASDGFAPMAYEPTFAAPAPRISDSPYRNIGPALGHELVREEIEQRELRPAYLMLPRVERFKVTNRESGEGARCLAVPAVMAMGSIKIEDEAADTLEWRNFSSGNRKGMSEIAVLSKEKTLWLDYLPTYVVCGAGSPQLSAVSTEDGALNVYSPAGRRLLPTLVLDSPCSFLEAEGVFLMAITAYGSIQVWDTRRKKSLFPPLNLSSLLTSSANRVSQFPTITTSAVLPNGSPLIALSSGTTYSYDGDLNSWIKISYPWFNKSEFWEGRRGKAGNGGRGIVRGVESAINEMLVETKYSEGKSDEEEEEEIIPETVVNSSATEQAVETRRRKKQKTVPSGVEEEELGSESTFRAALSFGHLEARLVAAVATDSPVEYKSFLSLYAKKLADEGIQNKAEELVKDLMGPIYFNPSRDDAWSPTVLSFNKRDLLKEVLNTFAKSRTLAKVGTENQELLRKLSAS